MTPQLSKTKSTLLTMEETARAAGGIKLLGTAKGYSRYTDLHAALTVNGYPASYATFVRLLNVVRPAQAAEVETIARFFGVQPRDLTGVVNPMKDPAPPRLVEFDLPEPVAGPKPSPLPVGRKPKALALDPEQVLALADSVNELTKVIREFIGVATVRLAPLRDVS